MTTRCSDCKREIFLTEPSYHWRGNGKKIDLCLMCGRKKKWDKLFNQEREDDRREYV